MWTAVSLVLATSAGACLGIVALALCSIQKNSATPVHSPTDVGGMLGRFDNLVDRSALVSALPAAWTEPPLAGGRGGIGPLSNDYRCAGSVAVTISDDRVWVDVDEVNVFRAYNVEVIQVDDRRVR